MAGFGDIPVRENGRDHFVDASWWNDIRTKLVQAFGEGAFMVVQPNQELDSDDEFFVDENAFKPLILASGNAGAINVNVLPFGSAHGFANGKEISIMGTSDTNTIKLFSNDAANGMILNGQSVVLKRWYKINLIYIESEERFIEIDRNF